MGAAGPAARPALAVEDVAKQPFDVFFSCFRFFHNRYPAYPLVARKGSERVPFFCGVCAGRERFFEVGGQFVKGVRGADFHRVLLF